MNKPLCSIAFVAAALAAALTVGPAPSLAQPAETFTAAVQQDDLNLARPAGRSTLRGRVKALANRVCGSVPVAPLREADAVAACRAELFRSAEAQVSLALAPASAEVAGTR